LIITETSNAKILTHEINMPLISSPKRIGSSSTAKREPIRKLFESCWLGDFVAKNLSFCGPARASQLEMTY
jgi:hypothetical protein